MASEPLASLGQELEGALESVRATAKAHGGRAMVGILPTLPGEDLHRGAITDAPRYRALDWSLIRVRVSRSRSRSTAATPAAPGGARQLPGPAVVERPEQP